jgi:hypothetical protein
MGHLLQQQRLGLLRLQHALRFATHDFRHHSDAYRRDREQCARQQELHSIAPGVAQVDRDTDGHGGSQKT